MDLPKLQKKLLAAARAHPPGEQVPYAFEKRIRARLADCLPIDPWRAWARGLTRAAAFCVVLSLFLSCIAVIGPESGADNLAQDLDQALFAAVDGGTGDPNSEIW